MGSEVARRGRGRASVGLENQISTAAKGRKKIGIARITRVSTRPVFRGFATAVPIKYIKHWFILTCTQSDEWDAMGVQGVGIWVEQPASRVIPTRRTYILYIPINQSLQVFLPHPHLSIHGIPLVNWTRADVIVIIVIRTGFDQCSSKRDVDPAAISGILACALRY